MLETCVLALVLTPQDPAPSPGALLEDLLAGKRAAARALGADPFGRRLLVGLLRNPPSGFSLPLRDGLVRLDAADSWAAAPLAEHLGNSRRSSFEATQALLRLGPVGWMALPRLEQQARGAPTMNHALRSAILQLQRTKLRSNEVEAHSTPASTAATDPRSAEQLAAAVRGGGAERFPALRVLLQRKPEEVLPLVEQLVELRCNADPARRADAEQVLRVIGCAHDATAIHSPKLLRLLPQEDRRREALAAALGGAGDSKRDLFAWMLRHPDAKLRGYAALAYGFPQRSRVEPAWQESDPTLAEQLAAAVRTDDPEAKRRVELARRVCAFELRGALDRLLPRLRADLASGVMSRVVPATHRIRRMGAPAAEATPELVRLLDNLRFANAAESALRSFGAALVPKLPKLDTLKPVQRRRLLAILAAGASASTTPLLLELLDPNAPLDDLGRALGGVDGAVAQAVVEALTDAKLRTAALAAVAACTHHPAWSTALPRAIPHVVAAIRADPSRVERLFPVLLAAPRESAAARIGLLDHAAKEVRRHTAMSLLPHPHPDAVPKLRAGLADPDLGVAAACLDALGACGHGDAQIAKEILATVSRFPAEQHGMVLRAAARVGVAEPKLVALLEQEFLADDRTRRAAVISMVPVAGPLATALVPKLVGALDDKDPRVVRMAIRQLGRMGPVATPALDALQKLASPPGKRGPYVTAAGWAIRQIRDSRR